MITNDSSIMEENAGAIANALKKAWPNSLSATDSIHIPIFLLGATGDPYGTFLAYDLDEFTAFLGGVYDGEFSSAEEARGKTQMSTENTTAFAFDWDSKPLPIGITKEALVSSLAAKIETIRWVHFGESGSPAWARITIVIDPSVHSSRFTLREIATEPPLTHDEIREIARRA